MGVIGSMAATEIGYRSAAGSRFVSAALGFVVFGPF